MPLAQNIQRVERGLSVAAGLTAILGGLYQGGGSGIFKMLGGVALLQRGLSGHCAIKGLMSDPKAEISYLEQRLADLRAASGK